MNRREFIALLSLALLTDAPRVDAGARSRRAAREAQRVLVIGAGIAGLAAAQALTRVGHDVTVLEARARTGGRIWTSEQWPAVPLDLGASWIHGVRGNPLTGVAHRLGAKRIATSFARTVTYQTSGPLLTRAEEARLTRIRKRLSAALHKAQNATRDTSVRQAVALLEGSFADDAEALRFLNFCLSSEIEHEYAGSADRLSAYWYDSGKAFRGDDVLFPHGFQAITDALAQEVDVRLSQVVKEIRWHQPEVELRTADAAFVADRVVITLPLGVLQHGAVRFVPALPADKEHAISKLGFGVLNKCYLRFARPFWPADKDWIQYIPEQHGAWCEWLSLTRATQAPVLLGFNAAAYGRTIEAWSDQKIVARAMATLHRIFGSDIPEPLDHQITRWASDPFARGAYSYNAVNTDPAMRETLARPLNGRLFFAGEACHKDYFGTTHGAYLSGLQAARDVLSA